MPTIRLAWRRWAAASLDLADALAGSFSIPVLFFGLGLAVYLLIRLVRLEDFPIYFFADEAVQTLFAEHLRLIQEVIPIHKELQDAGQIEVTMTPYAHPILPLLVSTDLAKEALPSIELPARKFTFGQDAVAQLELGVQLYQDHFGMPPRGMWSMLLRRGYSKEGRRELKLFPISPLL